MSVSAALQDRYDHLAAIAFDKQLALGDMLGDDHEWTFDMQTGMLGFTGPEVQRGPLAFPAQVLGSESALDGTWMWAWANQASNIPAALTAVSRQMCDYGQRELVPELAIPKLPLRGFDGHVLAMVVSGLVGASFYYRGPYDNGAVFLMVKVPWFPERPPSIAARIPRVMAELLQSTAIPPSNHDATIVDYLAWYGAQIHRRPSPQGSEIAGRLADGDVIASVDQAGRLLHIESR